MAADKTELRGLAPTDLAIALDAIAHCIRLRSLSLARWVDAYENHKQKH